MTFWIMMNTPYMLFAGYQAWIYTWEFDDMIRSKLALPNLKKTSSLNPYQRI